MKQVKPELCEVCSTMNLTPEAFTIANSLEDGFQALDVDGSDEDMLQAPAEALLRDEHGELLSGNIGNSVHQDGPFLRMLREDDQPYPVTRSASFPQNSIPQNDGSSKATHTRLYGRQPPFISHVIGSLEDIHLRSTRCAFCRLVLQSVQDQEIADLWSVNSGEWSPAANHSDVKKKAHTGKMNKLLKSECIANWTIDGREVTRDSDGSVTRVIDRTRRIRLQWDNAEIREAYIMLMAPTLEQGHNESLFLGRYMWSIRSNIPLIEKWINICDCYHGSRCKTGSTARLQEMLSRSFLAVVDVQEWRLANLPVDEKYATISHIWGRAPQFFATTENIAKLQTIGGISSVLDQLSTPIADALRLIKQLGIRYVWVDTLCIMQDNRAQSLVDSMSLIFQNSYLTICATDGEDGRAGLLALNTSSRLVQPHTGYYSKEVGLMVSHLTETYIQKSSWSLRAWTLQERLLSRRCLIFAGSRVFFQCRSSVMREDIVSERREAGWTIENTALPDIWESLESRAHEAYARTVESYTVRHLSFSGDRLSAFAGIGSLIGEAMGARLLHGLPNSCFDWALLWQPLEAPQRQISADLPSWSWCGWDGEPVSYEHTRTQTSNGLQEWLKFHTWIIWYVRDTNGDLRLVWDGRTENPELKQPKSRYPHIWDRSDAIINSDIFDPFGRPPLNQEFSFFQRTLRDYPLGVRIAGPITTADPPRSDLQYLQFFTWSASFTLHPSSPLPRKPPRKHRRFGIYDRNIDWCGTIVLDQAWFSKSQTQFQSKEITNREDNLLPSTALNRIDIEDSTFTLRPHRASSHSASQGAVQNIEAATSNATSAEPQMQERSRAATPTRAGRATYEFLALSDARSFSKEECTSWNYYIPKTRWKSESDWDLYYVLLVETDNAGVSTRVGLGKMFQKAFENGCAGKKIWKEIILR